MSRKPPGGNVGNVNKAYWYPCMEMVKLNHLPCILAKHISLEEKRPVGFES